jgi:hypothetical protein
MHGIVEQQLFTNTERLDDSPVALDIALFQVIQQMTSLTNQLQKASPRVVVLLVGLEMLRQVRNAIAEQRDLHFRRTRVVVVLPKALNDLLFLFSVKRHF